MPRPADYRALARLRFTNLWKGYPITEVVSGKARGADTFGERWAEVHRIPVAEFPAAWNEYGKAAGAIRNGLMAEYADAVVLFPGGRGTSDMFKQAVRHGLLIHDWR